MSSKFMQTMKERKIQPRDEYYTLLSDIEAEMKEHPGAFKDKVIYCNCDNPRYSKFFEYFAVNFETLGLRELITTHYIQPEKAANGKRATVSSYKGGSGADLDNILNSLTITEVDGDGSFDSAASIEQLQRADIVISNPPFSRWRDYFELLIDHKVDYLIVGINLALTYKTVIPHIVAGDIRVSDSRIRNFKVPGSDKHEKIAANWYTSLPRHKPRAPLTLTAKYDPAINKVYDKVESKLSRRDSYGSINVDRVKDIPADYYGEMGVPITFFEKHDTRQFEILDNIKPLLDGKERFQRLIIKRI